MGNHNKISGLTPSRAMITCRLYLIFGQALSIALVDAQTSYISTGIPPFVVSTGLLRVNHAFQGGLFEGHFYLNGVSP